MGPEDNVAHRNLLMSHYFICFMMLQKLMDPFLTESYLDGVAACDDRHPEVAVFARVGHVIFHRHHGSLNCCPGWRYNPGRSEIGLLVISLNLHLWWNILNNPFINNLEDKIRITWV